MSSFVYYLSGEISLNDKIIKKHELEYLFDGSSCSKATQTTQKGPDGLSGLCFCFEGDISLSVLMDGIEWAKLNDKTYVGYNVKHLPTPDRLLKKNITPGNHIVTLADNNSWIVPVARHINGSSQFTSWDRVDGEWVSGNVMVEHRELFDKACEIWDTLVSGEKEVVLTDVLDTAVLALSKNYRASYIEFAKMGTLTTSSAAEVCKALCDWPALEELKKKVERGELSLNAGEEE